MNGRILELRSSDSFSITDNNSSLELCSKPLVICFSEEKSIC